MTKISFPPADADETGFILEAFPGLNLTEHLLLSSRSMLNSGQTGKLEKSVFEKR